MKIRDYERTINHRLDTNFHSSRSHWKQTENSSYSRACRVEYSSNSLHYSLLPALSRMWRNKIKTSISFQNSHNSLRSHVVCAIFIRQIGKIFEEFLSLLVLLTSKSIYTLINYEHRSPTMWELRNFDVNGLNSTVAGSRQLIIKRRNEEEIEKKTFFSPPYYCIAMSLPRVIHPNTLEFTFMFLFSARFLHQ